MTQESLSQTLAQRGERYGVFADHARYSQLMKDAFKAYMGPSKYDGLKPDQKEALEMIFHKLARIANGDPNYADSWIDIAGYAKLVADRLESA